MPTKDTASIGCVGVLSDIQPETTMTSSTAYSKASPPGLREKNDNIVGWTTGRTRLARCKEKVFIIKPQANSLKR
jgi:hypothetical protein